MSNAPSFASAPRVKATTISALGGLVTVFAGAGTGSMVSRITFTAVGATVADKIILELNDGTDQVLIKEIPVEAITPSATVEAFRAQVPFNPPIFIQSAAFFQSDPGASNTFDVLAEGGDL